MPRRTLMFRLGQFVGNVARAVVGPDEKSPRRQVVRRDVQEQTTHQDNATVTLRRTTIEEIEVRPHPSEGTT